MKKHLKVIVILFSAMILTGCSLGTGSSKGGGIFRSDDAGKTWTAKNTANEKIDPQAIDVLNIAVDPNDSNRLLVGTRSNGILKSEDGGESWDLLNFQSEKAYGLVIDKNDRNLIYASGIWNGVGKMFRSRDFGNNWEEIYTSASTGPLVIYLIADPKDSKILFASTSDNQVIKSIDTGNSWKSIFQADTPITKITIDSVNNNLVYFSTNDGKVFRSQKGGENMENITAKVNDAAKSGGIINDIVTDPSNSGTVYAVGGFGILRSKNSGNNWEKVLALNNPDSFAIEAMAVNPKNSNELVYGAAQATYKSYDGGQSWVTAQFEASKSINVIRYSPSNGDIVYVGLSK